MIVGVKDFFHIIHSQTLVMQERDGNTRKIGQYKKESGNTTKA